MSMCEHPFQVCVGRIICVWQGALWQHNRVHVGYAITEVHCDGAVCKYDHQLKFVFYYDDAIEIYVSETENKAVRLDSHNAFLIIVLLHYKLFECAQCVLKNKPVPSRCQGKIGNTFDEPCPHGVISDKTGVDIGLLFTRISYSQFS